VAVGAVWDFVQAFLVRERVLHLERKEDALVEKVAELLAGNFFELPSRARSIPELLYCHLLPGGNCVDDAFSINASTPASLICGIWFVGGVAVLLGHEVFVVEEARRVIQDFADGDGFPRTRGIPERHR